MSAIASDGNGVPSHRGLKPAKRKRPVSSSSIRTQFVERSESWIKTLASELPESVLDAAMKNIDAAEQTVLSSSSKESIAQIQGAIMIRAVRAIKQTVQGMSEAALISAVSSASDFGALARALSDPHAADMSRDADPLAGAVGRSIEHRRKLADMAGEVLTSTQVTDLLGIKRQAIDKRRNAGKLLAFRSASDWQYPAFQFESDDISAGIGKVLAAHEGYDPWVLIDILLAPDDTLGGGSLLDAIREKDDEAVDRYLRQTQGDGYR